jgi:hypothetical protein
MNAVTLAESLLLIEPFAAAAAAVLSFNHMFSV